MQALTSLDCELEWRITDLVRTWALQPASLAIFGSGARGDGSADSDIDLLLIEPTVASCPETWTSQTHDLAEAIEKWTGNRVQIYALDQAALRAHISRGEPIVTQWRKEAKTLVGREVQDLLRELKK